MAAGCSCCLPAGASYNGDMELKGKVALVTGAGKRIGQAIALALAERGAGVAVHYRRSHQEAQATVERLLALGSEALAFRADLAEPDQIAAMFLAVEAKFGRRFFSPRRWRI